MKQQWADEELLEAWQIWPAEQHMIEKKRGTRSRPLDIVYEMPIVFKWITP